MNNVSQMKYGYIDESGTPGTAIHNNDWLVVSLVVFESKKKCEESELALDELRTRLNLSGAYEFHRTHNSSQIQIKVEKVLKSLEYKIIVVAIKKHRKTVNYADLAESLVEKMLEHGLLEMSIIMDSNPVLYKNLMHCKKMKGLRKIKIKEGSSKKHLNLQLADYTVNIGYRYAKMANGAEKDFRKIRKHMLGFYKESI